MKIKKKGKNILEEDLDEEDLWDYSKNVSVRFRDNDAPKVYTINLFHVIDWDAIKYKPYFDVFEKARENDEIIIYLNSPGGSVETLNMFLNAIRICKCKNIIARVNDARSAAAILALACDKIMFNENATLMFHTFSMWGVHGKEQELMSEIQHSAKNYKKMVEKYLQRIMSQEEIEEMANGKDFFFNEEEATKRLVKYGKAKKNK